MLRLAALPGRLAFLTAKTGRITCALPPVISAPFAHSEAIQARLRVLNDVSRFTENPRQTPPLRLARRGLGNLMRTFPVGGVGWIVRDGGPSAGLQYPWQEGAIVSHRSRSCRKTRWRVLPVL